MGKGSVILLCMCSFARFANKEGYVYLAFYLLVSKCMCVCVCVRDTYVGGDTSLKISHQPNKCIKHL